MGTVEIINDLCLCLITPHQIRFREIRPQYSINYVNTALSKNSLTR